MEGRIMVTLVPVISAHSRAQRSFCVSCETGFPHLFLACVLLSDAVAVVDYNGSFFPSFPTQACGGVVHGRLGTLIQKLGIYSPQLFRHQVSPINLLPSANEQP